MIEGVRLIELRRIPDERGMVMHMLRSDAEHFTKFGEIYFSTAYPGVVKAWHLHDRMTLRYAVPVGTVKVALFDPREASPTRGQVEEIVLGEHAYRLLIVPPRVWNGFKNVGPQTALVANCADLPHDPTEIHRLDPDDKTIPYRWT